jgi:hypothetical protein
MRTALFIFLLLIGSRHLQAQQSFQYNDYFHYRNHLYLQTPSVFLNAAGLKAVAKDTTASIQYMKQAAKAGLFDTTFITNNSRLQYITKRKEWDTIRQIVQHHTNWYANPARMYISFTDVLRFWKIYDQLDAPGGDSLLINEYILEGSSGLRTFFEKRMGLQANKLIAHIRKKKKYFASIRNVSANLYQYKPAMIDAAKKLKEIYPAAIFPPTYFTIGAFEAFGTTDGGAGQLIGAEFLVDRNTVDTTELSAFEKYAIADTSRITGIFIHELVHSMQQTVTDNSLLARSINEGAADFITHLVLNYNINSKIHVYGNVHEKELWKQFSKKMHSEETEEWLYNGMTTTGERPADLGYYIGYKICEAYYNKTTDKKQAVKDILTIQDFKLFLEKSGYGR